MQRPYLSIVVVMQMTGDIFAVYFQNQEAISEASGSSADGFVECSFLRDIQSSNAKIYNLDEEFFLLLGVGPVSGSKMNILLKWLR